MTANVFLAILAKQKEKVLPLFLKTIEDLDYPKENIFLYVRTNNNTDKTTEILKEWLDKNHTQYKGYTFDYSNVKENVEKYKVHEWNGERFRVLGRIRQESIKKALESDCDYYFVIDVDNFIFPETLKSLIEANKPIVAPLLRYALATPDFPDSPEDNEKIKDHEGKYYSNFHYVVDDYGSIINEPNYYQLLYQRDGYRGLYDVDCVHCTYLINKKYLDKLTYLEESDRWEYMVFSESARKNRIDQYLDNRKIYGVLTLTENAEASKFFYKELRDPDTREKRYKELNISDIWYDPAKYVILEG